ncbi:MAG: hypothetical protein ACR2FU_10295 [Streptosporangiaceae bacterium]
MGKVSTAAGVLIAGVASALAVAGCGAQAAKVALPGKPARAHLAGAKAPPASPRGLVLAAYEGYWHATSVALASRDPAKAKAILAGYVPAHTVPALVKGLEGLWRRHEIGFGNPVFHIMSIKVTGPGIAAVHDCLDLSHAGFQNAQTGQVVGGFGQSHEFMITTLALEHGRWLVTGAIPVVQSCAY